MAPSRALPLLAPFICGCNLFVSLEPLQGGGEGGEASSSGTLSGPSSSSTGAGAAGGGGAGGAPPTAWERCVASKSPLIHLRMSGSITEPNLGSTKTNVPSATYYQPHSTVPGLLVAEADEAASFDDPLSDIGDADEDESGRLELADPGGFAGLEQFSIELWFRTPESFDGGALVSRQTATGGFRLELGARQVSDGLDNVTFFMFDDTMGSLSYDERRRQVGFNADLSQPDEVHHVVFLYRRSATTTFDLAGNADDLVLWLDGVRTPLQACCGPIPLPAIAAPLSIGNGYSGAIDELVVHGRVLSDAEIQLHHAVGRGEAGASCD